MASAQDGMAAWHRVVEARDAAELPHLLAEDVVFESPVVHTPQAGKAITTTYLTAALAVLNNEHFHYLNEWRGENSAVLEFQTAIDGIAVNGVDIIHWNDEGKISRFKVMLRPLKAINQVHQMMAQQLMAMKGV